MPTLKMAPQARSCFRNAASLAGLKRAATRVRRALRSHRAAARAQAARANASKKWHTVPRRVRGAGPQFADGARIFLVTVRKHAWVGQNPEGGVLSIALCHSQARLHAHTEMWSRHPAGACIRRCYVRPRWRCRAAFGPSCSQRPWTGLWRARSTTSSLRVVAMHGRGIY